MDMAPGYRARTDDRNSKYLLTVLVGCQDETPALLVFFTGEGRPGHTDSDAKADAAGISRGISWADQDVAVIRLDQLHSALQRRQTVASYSRSPF